MFKHTQRFRQMEVCLCCCSSAVTLLSHQCLWFPGHAWKAVCILLEGSGISCSIPALIFGGGPLACQVEMLNGVGDKVQTHFYVGLSEITKVSAFSLNSQQIPARLVPSISFPGSCRSQHCFLGRGVTPQRVCSPSLMRLISDRKSHTFLSILLTTW